MEEFQQSRSLDNSLFRFKHSGYFQGVNLLSSINNRSLISKSKSSAKSLKVAAKKHNEAKRRRRMRINGQYETLRAILPNLVKACVLTETVKRVLELKKAASQLESMKGGTSECMMPNAADILSVSYCDGDHKGLLKATISCEDKIGHFSDITNAVKSVKGKLVKAEIVTLGGRTKFVLLMQGLNGVNEGLVMLRRALEIVVDKSQTSHFFWNREEFITSIDMQWT